MDDDTTRRPTMTAEEVQRYRARNALAAVAHRNAMDRNAPFVGRPVGYVKEVLSGGISRPALTAAMPKMERRK